MKILKKGKKKKGFTLIELIAVVAILIILAVILVPNIVGYVNKSKIASVKNDAKVVLNIIKASRAQASDPDKITDYADAIDSSKGGEADLAASKAPATSLTTLDDKTLESIIDNTSTNWSDYSQYAATSSTTSN